MIKKLKDSIHVRHASILMIGTVLAQIINLISSPIITRLFSPEQFGILSLYSSIIGPLAVIATMRLETALVIAQDNEEKSLLKAFIYKLIIVTTFLTIVFILGVFLFTKVKFQSWFILIPIGILFHTVHLIENSDKNYHKNYQKISSTKVLQALTMALTAIFLGYFFNKPNSLIISSITALIVAWLFLRYPFSISSTKKFLFKNAKPIINNYSRYFYFTMPASLLDTVSQQIPIFILSYYATKEMTGYYGLALKVLILPTHIVGASIAQVFLRRFSELWNERSSNLKGQLLKTWGALFLIGLAPFSSLYFFGEELFTLVFGQQWQQAGFIASLISPMLFVNFISGPSSSAILVQNNHKLGLYFGINALITRSLALFYGVYKGDIFLGFKLWVIVEIISMLAYSTTILIHIIKRESNSREEL